MKLLSILLFVLLPGCATQAPVVTPPIPCPACPPPITIHKHDTTYIHDTAVEIINIAAQLSNEVYEINIPRSVDDYPSLQANIDTAIAKGYREIHLSTVDGSYHCNQGLTFRNPSGAFLEGIHFYGDGGAYGKPMIYFTNGTSFGINFLRSKGCICESIIIQGANKMPGLYNISQVLSADKLSFVSPGVSDMPDRPHAGFVVDGYPSQIGAGGSTDIIFRNCRAQYFVVDYCLAPGGYLQNGEIIKIENCWGDYCKAAISTGGSQQRSVFINNFHCWGWTETVFDCQSYGNGMSCPPYVDGLNAAGCIRYLCKLGTWISEGLVMTNSHVESLWSLGGCLDGYSNKLTIRDSWINFAGTLGSIKPPVYVFKGGEIIIDNSMIWQYGADIVLPLVFDAFHASFNHTTFDYVPNNVCVLSVTIFEDCLAEGKRFGDDLCVSRGVGPTQLHSSSFLWIGKMRCEYTDGFVRTRIASSRNQEYFIPQLIVGDIYAGSNVIRNVVVEGGADFVKGIPLYTPGIPIGTIIIAYAGDSITLSAQAFETWSNAAIISGDWHGESGYVDSRNPYKIGFKLGDIMRNDQPDHYPGVVGFVCIKSGITGTNRLPEFKAY